MDKKYQIFVSSTYKDLKEERLAIYHTIVKEGHIPTGMEHFPANGISQFEYIKKQIDNCDYYLLIVSGRYGSVADDGISYTEKEFDYAQSNNIPIMVFTHENYRSLPQNKCEDTDEGKKKLDAFIKKLKSHGLINNYTTIENLKSNILHTLHKIFVESPRTGWVRDNSVNNSVSNNRNIIPTEFTKLEGTKTLNLIKKNSSISTIIRNGIITTRREEECMSHNISLEDIFYKISNNLDALTPRKGLQSSFLKSIEADLNIKLPYRLDMKDDDFSTIISYLEDKLLIENRVAGQFMLTSQGKQYKKYIANKVFA